MPTKVSFKLAQDGMQNSPQRIDLEETLELCTADCLYIIDPLKKLRDSYWIPKQVPDYATTGFCLPLHRHLHCKGNLLPRMPFLKAGR